jgi:AAA domain
MLDANAIAREQGNDALRDIIDVSVVPLRPKVRPRVMFERTSTTTIMSTRYPPLRAIVPGYLYEGFTVLAGRQKLGKTWLGIDWAVAVSMGGIAMGSIPCNQGDVLYIDMENGPRRIQGRINTLFPNERDRPDLSRLEWVTDAPQLDQGFIAGLERWRTSVSVPTLVIIDVLQRIKPAGSTTRNAYENDYSIWSELQTWSTENRVAVLGLHHTKKGGADDPLEALSGSNGLSACADTTIVLDQDQNGRTLYVRGRDVEEKETAVIFAAGNWTVLGEASDVRRSDERSVIIDTLNDNREPMTPGELAAALGKQPNNIKQLLFKMAKVGDLYRVGNGRYWTDPVHPHNPDNRSNPEGDDDE